MNMIIIAIFAILAGGGLLGAVLATTTGKTIDLQHRLAGFDEATEPEIISVRDQELREPFMKRVILPWLNSVGEKLAKRAGTTDLASLQRQLDSVGFNAVTASGFLTLRFVGAFAGVAVSSLLVYVAAIDVPLNIVMIAALGAVGFILPQSRLTGAIRKRQKRILKALPSALDLLTICVQGGLSFDAALQEIGSKYRNDFSLEINTMLNEVRLGRPRREALRSMEQRIGVYEVTSFVDAVLQSEQLGSPIANALQIHSEEIRRRRRQRAEEMGQKAPIKMLLPLVGCIFPTIFVILLGPAALIVLRQVVGVPQ